VARTLLEWVVGDRRRSLDFDAVELESPRHDATFTEYPIEMGSSLVDHIRQRPISLRMTAMVSNSPIRENLSHMDGTTPNKSVEMVVLQPIIRAPQRAQLPTSIAGMQLAKTVPVRAAVRTWPTPVQRVQNVYIELRQAMAEARAFTIITDLMGDFDGMVLKSMGAERANRTGNGMRLDLEFQQLMYGWLKTEEIGLRLPKAPVHPRSMPQVNEGKKEATQADAATQRSVAHMLFK
jgi:hypothetical protein